MKQRFVWMLALLTFALVSGRAMVLRVARAAPTAPPPQLGFIYHDDWWSTGSYAAEASAYRTVAGDFNGDGLDDVAMLHRTNASTARFYVIPGAGDHFGSHTVWLTLNLDADIMSERVVAGDFNNDGYDDVAAFGKVTAANATRLYVFLSNGSGFETAIWWVGSLAYSDLITGRVVAGDFDGDGRADDIATLYDVDNGGSRTRLHTFISDGSTFSGPATRWSADRFAAANAQYRTVAGDVDADGDDDVVMVFQAVDFDMDGPDDTVAYVLLAGEGAFTIANWWESDGYIAGRTTGRVAAGDFDGDGDDDVALLYDYVPEGLGTRGHILLSTREAFSYQGSDPGWWDGSGYNASLVTGRVVAGDWNGDGVDGVSMIYDADADQDSQPYSVRADVLEATAPAPQAPKSRQVDGDNPACSDAAGEPYCTIQAAVDAASDGDTIQVAGGGYSEHVSAPKYDDPGFNQTLTIRGAGVSSTFVDGGNSGTVFTIHPGGKVTLSQLTIRNGRAADGGGIYNDAGVVTISDSTVSENLANRGGGIYNLDGMVAISDSTVGDNSAGDRGGGIYNLDGMVTIGGSTISGNTTDNDGGGIFIDGFYDSPVTVISSTFTDNAASDDGGGIFSLSTLTVSRSTFSGNTAGGLGGAIHNFADSDDSVTINSSTFSGNTAGQGGGLFADIDTVINNSTFSRNAGGDQGGGIYAADNAVLTLANNIVANSTAGFDCAGPGTWNAAGNPNLDSDGTCPGFTLTGNPLLGPLQDNGGATETHALLDGSPAIDAGSNAACPETDQRGLPRPHDGNGDGASVCDLGAFEYLSQHFIYLPLAVKP